ncbi:MAG: hypothetical protein R6V06_05140 [Kiritimatiellia bacterium]
MYNCSRRKLLSAMLVSAFFSTVRASAGDMSSVPQEAVDELGVEYGTPQRSGFVFIDGAYIPYPYTVTRYGNGVFINRIQVEKPVPWSYFHPEIEDSAGKNKISAVEDNREQFGTPEQETVQQPSTSGREVPDNITSIDDLFNDDNKPSPETAANETSKVETLDDLFINDADGVSSPHTDDAPQDSPAAAMPEKLTPEQLKRRKKLLKQYLDEQRMFYERALSRDELYFFGTSHSRINGTYGSAKVLFEVLPSALRHARSPADLYRRLRRGGVYFVDLGVCKALYRNKKTFPLLQQRLKRIRRKDADKEAERKKKSFENA